MEPPSVPGRISPGSEHKPEGCVSPASVSWSSGQFPVEAALCRRRWRAKPAATSQTDFMKASAPSSKTDKTLPWTGKAVKGARRAFILTLGSPPRRLRLVHHQLAVELF